MHGNFGWKYGFPEGFMSFNGREFWSIIDALFSPRLFPGFSVLSNHTDINDIGSMYGFFPEASW